MNKDKFYNTLNWFRRIVSYPLRLLAGIVFIAFSIFIIDFSHKRNRKDFEEIVMPLIKL